MIPVGYLAKQSCKKPKGFGLSEVEDIYSVSSCVNDDLEFVDKIDEWSLNGYWLFDSPEIIQAFAQEHSIDLSGTQLFYYEAYETQFDGATWKPFPCDAGIRTNVVPPAAPHLEGFDVVTFYCGNAPECSPLSCCALAKEIKTNAHCLIDTFDQAKAAIDSGQFHNSEPGPYRIFAVYSVDWPSSSN